MANYAMQRSANGGCGAPQGPDPRSGPTAAASVSWRVLQL